MPDLIRILRPWVSRSARLSWFYRRLRDELASRGRAKLTPLGFKFAGNAQMVSGVFEPAETRLVRALMPSVTTVINVGANIGYYCCIGLQAGNNVVGFEPFPLNQRLLVRNINSNGWMDRFEFHPIAIADSTGIVKLYGSGTGASLLPGWSGQVYSTTVPVSTLDSVLGRRFESESCLIIVDVEGAELRVLKGADRSLRNVLKPIWLVEIEMMSHQPAGERYNPNFVATFELFHDLGYVALTATSRPRGVTMEEVRQAQRSGVRTFGTNNFLFVEASRVGEILSACGHQNTCTFPQPNIGVS